MKEKLIRFMQGRYGIDQLSKLLIVLGVVAVLVSAFVNWGVLGLIIYFLGWVLVIWGYFRVFSRNVSKRYAENEAFLAKTSGSGIFSETEVYVAAEKSISYL